MHSIEHWRDAVDSGFGFPGPGAAVQGSPAWSVGSVPRGVFGVFLYLDLDRNQERMQFTFAAVMHVPVKSCQCKS